MERRALLRNALAVVLVSVTMLSSVGASSTSGFFYVEALEVEDADSGVRTIEMDSNGHIFASFGSILYKMTESGAIVGERVFSNEITATSISPDNSRLALTVRSASSGTDSVYAISTGDLSTIVASDATRMNADLLEWSPNGAELYTNAPDNGILQLSRENLEQEAVYTGNHSGSMACVDVSETTGTVLTADVNGLIHLWDNDGEVIHHEILLQSMIYDCHIGANDEFFSVSTADDGIRKWTFGGSELKPIDVNDALRYQFTSDANILIIHKDSPAQHLFTYDAQNEEILDEVMMFHNFDDYVLRYNQFNSLVNIYMNSDVDNVVKYGLEVFREGEGESGTDTDGDGIPDSIDADDDGDGIEDNWDLNCEDIGISCELLPDENFIRTIDLEINSTHAKIKQSFTLNKKHSSSIRNLARYSLDADIKLIESEAQLFADSICSNMDLEQLAETMLTTFEFSNMTLSFVEMNCLIEDGMVLYAANDAISQIRYSVVLVFAFNASSSIDGLVVEVQNNRFPSDGSITELSEQHPLAINVYGGSIETMEYVPWHIQEDKVTFTLQSNQIESDSLGPTSILTSFSVILFVVLTMATLGIVAFLLTKRGAQQNTYNIVLDDEDEDDDYLEDYVEEDESYETMGDNTDQNVTIEDAEDNVQPESTRPRRRIQRSKRKKAVVQNTEPNDAKQLLESSSNEVVRKRRARRSEHDTVKTKKRKLSDSESIDARPRRRRAVKRSLSSDENMDETLKRFVSDSPEER
ncbi:MAG TPA: WD40 repeat domain-containing protein [Candidatus Poseidoniales archaeon]|nr:MAG TPA: WD40 repeat domain-containing protein [Candidatus Poseidoniales archaeon]HII24929.1 WD40 repeat domain-containing protein [Candidatus Poseidoniaceae archaeon]|tara:strand:- start:505 stop:2766 length:2262 start_codon:yes stop_codon:yes gene_type:complete